jgi:toxin ParE1/3/4
MKSRQVSLSESAQRDLFDIEVWLETQTSKRFARNYTDRLVEYCTRLDIASRRGSPRDDVLPGLRIIGFERRLTIAFAVHDDRVEILRVFRGGRDWEAELSED